MRSLLPMFVGAPDCPNGISGYQTRGEEFINIVGVEVLDYKFINKSVSKASMYGWNTAKDAKDAPFTLEVEKGCSIANSWGQ